MSLSIAEIRRIIERHPLPEKYSKEQMQQWIIELGAEIANNLIENVEASEKLASKEDIHQIRSDIKEMRQETKDDIKQLIEMSNARFESLRQEMNVRFEAMEKSNTARFEALQKEQMALRQEMNARFEAMEKANTARFEALQKQIDGVQNQIKFLMWYLGAGGVLVILKLFFPHIFPH